MSFLSKLAGATSLLSLAAAVGPANAADLPTKAYAPAPVAAAIYNWTGFYVGVNGGYGWGSQDPLNLFSSRFDRSSFNINGGMFGGAIGAQIQQSYVVLGLEADLDWANIKGTGTTVPTIGGVLQGPALNVTTNTSAVATGRARVGVALNNWLLYGTGGVAFIKTTAAGTAIGAVPCGALGIIASCNGSVFRAGLAAGLGAEWGFTQNWSAKLEYLYIATAGSGASMDRVNTVRGGINYRF